MANAIGGRGEGGGEREEWESRKREKETQQVVKVEREGGGRFIE